MGWSLALTAGDGLYAGRVTQGTARRWPVRGRSLVWAGYARLDNARALAAQLGLPATVTAAELIGHAYAVWGAGFPARLLGDFAFALLDEAAQTLWLVRDHLGVAPLYYHCGAAGCYASDALDPLLAQPGLDPSLDERVVAQWCAAGRVYHPTATFYSALRKVPKATALRIDRAGVTAQNYWPLAALSPLRYAREADYVDHLRDLLGTIIRDRLDASPVIAAHSSGGLDSTPIAILAGRAARSRGQAVQTYNWCQPDAGELAPCHEWDDARRVARDEGFRHQEIGITAEALKHSLLHHVIARDGTTTFEYETAVLAAAQAHGARVIFSGFGGDELLTLRARERHERALLAGQWAAVWRRLALEEDPQTPFRALRRGAQLARLISAALRPAADPPAAWRRTADARWAAHRALLTAELARRVDDAPSPGGLEAFHRAATLHARQRSMLDLGYHQERLETWAALGRRVGVRHVYPYLDKRIVEFALALPAEWYYRHGQSRYLYRRALGDALPDYLRNKPKPPEIYRVRQLVQARQRALTDPEVLEYIAAARSPYIDTRVLLQQCRAAAGWNPADWQTAIPALKALTTAVLALRLTQA